MLASNEAMATIAVKDIAKAKSFYENKLGLKKQSEEDEHGVATYKSGSSTIVVYESEFAGTNKATSATWSVGDELESIVKRLKDAGVPFEHYDMPGLERKGEIHIADGFRAAWFRDPDGNILHINSM